MAVNMVKVMSRWQWYCDEGVRSEEGVVMAVHMIEVVLR